MTRIRTYRDLNVFVLSFELAKKIFEISKQFPQEEKYSLTDQMRRSSRSVSANIAEAFSARRYPKSFVSKLIIAECEAAETQTWLDFSLAFNYIEKQVHHALHREYSQVIAMLVNMTNNPEKWVI